MDSGAFAALSTLINPAHVVGAEGLAIAAASSSVDQAASTPAARRKVGRPRKTRAPDAVSGEAGKRRARHDIWDLEEAVTQQQQLLQALESENHTLKRKLRFLQETVKVREDQVERLRTWGPLRHHHSSSSTDGSALTTATTASPAAHSERGGSTTPPSADITAAATAAVSAAACATSVVDDQQQLSAAAAAAAAASPAASSWDPLLASPPQSLDILLPPVSNNTCTTLSGTSSHPTRGIACAQSNANSAASPASIGGGDAADNLGQLGALDATASSAAPLAIHLADTSVPPGISSLAAAKASTAQVKVVNMGKLLLEGNIVIDNNSANNMGCSATTAMDWTAHHPQQQGDGTVMHAAERMVAATAGGASTEAMSAMMVAQSPTAALAANALPASLMQEVSMLMRLGSQQLVESYKQTCDVMSRVLFVAEEGSSSPQGKQALAQISAIVQRLKQLGGIVKVVNPDAHSARAQPVGKGMCPAPPQHWDAVAASLMLTPEQVEEVEMLYEMQLRFVRQIQQDHEVLSKALSEVLQDIQLKWAVTQGSTYLRRAEMMAKLQRMIGAERWASVLVDEMMMHILADLQIARLIVHSYPYVPDCRRVVEAVHRLHKDPTAHNATAAAPAVAPALAGLATSVGMGMLPAAANVLPPATLSAALGVSSR